MVLKFDMWSNYVEHQNMADSIYSWQLRNISFHIKPRRDRMVIDLRALILYLINENPAEFPIMYSKR